MKELIKNSTLTKYIDKGKNIVVCVSTGIDSMSLFHFLYSNSYKVVVAHVNHKKRIESDAEYDYLMNYCKDRNIPFFGYIMPPIEKGNFQERARKLRYEFFLEVAKKCDTDQIVTAHQMDDKVETILMRLIRGSSLKGYGGIKELSYVDGYKIIRPLLNTTREEIEAYQKENNILYFEDKTNKEDHYTRNIIRHNVSPVLKRINSDFYRAINYYSDDISEMYEFIDKAAMNFLNDNSNKNNREISFKMHDFNSLDTIVKKQVILRSINILSKNSQEITHQKIDEILSHSFDHGESRLIEIGGDIILSIEYGNFVFYKNEQIDDVYLKIQEPGEYHLNGYGKIIISHNYHLLPNKKSYLMCYNITDKIYPIVVRNVIAGDKIIINNITKKVFDLLKDNKIPKRNRSKTLVFIVNDEILFIPNIARKETDKTKSSKIYFTYIGETYEN